MEKEEPRWLGARYLSTNIAVLMTVAVLFGAEVTGLLAARALLGETLEAIIIGIPIALIIMALCAYLFARYIGLWQFKEAFENDPRVLLVRQFPNWSFDKLKFASLINLGSFAFYTVLTLCGLTYFFLIWPVNIFAYVFFAPEYLVSGQKKKISGMVRALTRLFSPFFCGIT